MTSELRSPEHLSDKAEHIIGLFATQFDGYAYAGTFHPLFGDAHDHLGHLLRRISTTGKFSMNPSENFAANFYLHRSFRWSAGELPGTFAPGWFDMVFFYLHLYRQPVPPDHRRDSHEWQQRPKGAAEQAAAEIRQLLRRSAR
jgi:hypothetical protein